MIVDANKPFRLVFSLNTDTELGAVIEPYVVQLNENQTLSLTYQKIYANTLGAFEKVMDREDKAIIKLTSEYTPDIITKKFSKKKDLRPQEFIAKHLDDKLLKDVVRPYIEEKIIRCLELLNEKQLWLRSKAGNPAHQPIEIADTEVSTHFHFHKNEEGTKYYPSFRFGDEKLSFVNKEVTLLTNHPCRLLLNNKIYSFEKKLEGKKLTPFFTKWNIQIPRASESTYFKRFVSQLVENHTVIADGFKIYNYNSPPSALLKFEIAWNNEAQLQLLFDYKKEKVSAADAKEVIVKLEKNGEQYIYYKTTRNLEAENVLKTQLKTLGLQKIDGAVYKPSQLIQEGVDCSASKMINWLSENRENLEQAGIYLLQDNSIRNYFIGKVDLDFRIEEKNDWFDVYAQVQFGEFKIPFIKLKKYILNGKSEFELPDGRIAIIPEAWFSKYKDLLLLSSENEVDEKLRMKKHHFGLVYSIFQPEESEAKAKEAQKSLFNYLSGTPEDCPENFENILRPYQKEGFHWMKFLNKNNFGGILADDMGLGKTIQTLTLLSAEKIRLSREEPVYSAPAAGQLSLFNAEEAKPVNNIRIRQNKPSIIIMPTSLIHNWEFEVKKFAPNLKLLNYTGLQRQDKIKYFLQSDVILTTYGTIRNDIDILKNYEFNYIILDESQVIKNPLANISKAVKTLRSKFRLSLSGTPIENSLLDLWSQMSFLNPGMLGSYQVFKDEFVYPIEKKNDEERKEKLKAIIQPFILRRTKEEVAKDLPELTEKIYFSEMSSEQQKVYEETRNFYRHKILENIEKHGEGKSQFFILKGLMQLRLIANHPKMHNTNFEGESGKFNDILETLDGILSENHKVLVFSQFVRHLELIKAHLTNQKIPHAILTGSTTKRQQVINDFKKDEEKRVFLISLKAGGVGLNLTEADYVLMCDPWWNPAAELQAINRAHRIGQDKRVFAYKFISKNTVEEKILQLQERKLRLSSDLIETNKGFEKIISKDDIEVLFS